MHKAATADRKRAVSGGQAPSEGSSSALKACVEASAMAAGCTSFAKPCKRGLHFPLFSFQSTCIAIAPVTSLHLNSSRNQAVERKEKEHHSLEQSSTSCRFFEHTSVCKQPASKQKVDGHGCTSRAYSACVIWGVGRAARAVGSSS